MSTPLQSLYENFENFSGIFCLNDLMESRFENDANGNPIFIGYTLMPNGATDEPIWFIMKIEYTANAITRKRLPSQGIKLGYVWDDRNSYFV